MLQVIQQEGSSWKMVIQDQNKPQGLAPPIFQQVLRSSAFHAFILLMVLASAIAEASLSFDHSTKDPDNKKDTFYYIEVTLSAVFQEARGQCLLHSFRGQCLVTKFKGPVSGYTVLGISVWLHSLKDQCLVTQFKGPVSGYTV